MLDEKKTAHLMYGFCALLILGVIFYIVWSSTLEKPDSESHCYKSIKGKMVIFIDKTDDIPLQTQEEIVQRAWSSIEKNTSEGDLVSVYEITQDSLSSLKPSFRMCRPRSEGSILTENVKKIEASFKAKFEQPLLQILSHNTGIAQNSPIAEAVMDVSLSDNLRNSEQNRILIFSDLMQHSNNVSTYHCLSADIAIENFKKSRLGTTERPTFLNTIVELHVIPRLKINKNEVQCRNIFWNWFFGDMRGINYGVEIIDLPGSYGVTLPTK
jgi:hypothetical protein